MENISSFIAWIELHPVTGGAILTAAIGVSGFIILKIGGLLFSNKPKIYMDSVFYSFGQKYVVVAVHEYVPSASGYQQIQHSLPSQWGKLITIKSSFFGLRHKIVPANASAHLAVVIRPNKKGSEKTVLFNR